MRAAVTGGRGAYRISSARLRERTAGMRGALSGPLVSRRGGRGAGGLRGGVRSGRARRRAGRDEAPLRSRIRRRAAAIWTLAAVAFVGVELALGGAPLHRVSVAFAAGTGVSALLLFALVMRRPRSWRARATLEPVGATQWPA
jgi:hypothetical protein